MLRLRIKSENGTHSLEDKVSDETSLGELNAIISNITSISIANQKILFGFPRKLLIGNKQDTLKDLGIKNGDVLFVERESLAQAQSPVPVPNEDHSIPSPLGKGLFIKEEVPSDNSCLFASIYFLKHEAKKDEGYQKLRHVVANTIQQNEQRYQGFLEKPISDYCQWILQDTSWGGDIELSILSEHYKTEIVVLDVKNKNLNRFGQDSFYQERIFIMYDGIHYDPIYLQTTSGEQQLVFSTNSDDLFPLALTLMEEAHKSRQYTDVQNICMKCQLCNKVFRQNAEVSEHVKKTGHADFVEVPPPSL